MEDKIVSTKYIKLTSVFTSYMYKSVTYTEVYYSNAANQSHNISQPKTQYTTCVQKHVVSHLIA